MPGYERQRRLVELAVDDVEVGAADPAGVDFEQYLTFRRLWRREFDRLEGVFGAIENERSHT
jgi:hypothetical protein